MKHIIKVNHLVTPRQGQTKAVRIITISDIHFGKKMKIEKVKRAFQLTESLKPNYICLLGDNLDTTNVVDEPTKKDEFLDILQYSGEIAPTMISLADHDQRYAEDGHIKIDYREDLWKQVNDIKNVHVLHNEGYEDEDVRFYGYTLPSYYYHGKYEKAATVFENFLQEPMAWLENKLEAVRFLSYSLQAMGRQEKAFDMLLQGLRLAPPTGEHCCDIGRYFYDREKWETAVFWYENALHAEKRTEKGAFVQEECYGYLPCIQLCVCYDRLGEHERAKMYNEMAGVLHPESEAVRKNRGYFLEKEKSSLI